MIVEIATVLTDEIYAAIQSLVPQLGSDKIIPTKDEIESIIESDSSTLLIARHPGSDGPIAGILTLAIYRVPTGIRSIVEDVVVDMNFRRRGIAEALLKQAIEVARSAGAGNISLSSNPGRTAAISLYEKLGFQRRDAFAFIIFLK